LATHVQEQELRSFQQSLDKIRGKELELRVKYLLNEIDEDTWKVRLQQNELALEYTTELSQLFQMLSTVSTDLLGTLYNFCNQLPEIRKNQDQKTIDTLYNGVKVYDIENGVSNMKQGILGLNLDFFVHIFSELLNLVHYFNENSKKIHKRYHKKQAKTILQNSSNALTWTFSPAR
jgi:hypothetical protein